MGSEGRRLENGIDFKNAKPAPAVHVSGQNLHAFGEWRLPEAASPRELLVELS